MQNGEELLMNSMKFCLSFSVTSGFAGSPLKYSDGGNIFDEEVDGTVERKNALEFYCS